MKGKNLFSYYLKIFGCQMNFADAQRIFYLLKNKGIQLANENKKPEVVIILTCGVRRSAEQRAISWIKKTREINPASLFVLSGCLSRREDIQKILENTVDLFLPVINFPEEVINLVSLIKTKNKELSLFKAKKIRKISSSSCFYEGKAIKNSSFRAFVPIMSGCNNYCSYCVVPYARGAEKSRSPHSIIKEVKSLIFEGCKEIYLLGQNVNSYNGIDKNNRKISFTKLIKQIDKLPGKFWVKYLSSHPKDVNLEFIKVLSNSKKISPNFHLPIQSGSTRILKLMNRKYTSKQYLKLYSKIKQYAPNTVISSDIIVGFPTETNEDFQDSIKVLRKCKFEMLYPLKYSPRPGTEAYRLQDDVPNEIKKERQNKLNQEWKKIATRINKKFLGKEMIIIGDKIKEKVIKGKTYRYLYGRSFEEKNVSCLIGKKNDTKLIGKWIRIKITKNSPLCLFGELLEVEK